MVTTESLTVGCKRVPITTPGFRVTKSIPFCSANFLAAVSANVFDSWYHFYQMQNEQLNNGTVCELKEVYNWYTFVFSQKSGFEYQVSSTKVSSVRGFPVHRTAAKDDVRITLLMVDTLEHDLRTLSVPFTAGSIKSAWNV